MPIVYTGGNTVGETRADQSSGSAGRQGVVILGLFRLEGFTSMVFTARTLIGIRGPYTDFKKVGTLFFQVEHMDSYVLRV